MLLKVANWHLKDKELYGFLERVSEIISNIFYVGA